MGSAKLESASYSTPCTSRRKWYTAPEDWTKKCKCETTDGSEHCAHLGFAFDTLRPIWLNLNDIGDGPGTPPLSVLLSWDWKARYVLSAHFISQTYNRTEVEVSANDCDRSSAARGLFSVFRLLSPPWCIDVLSLDQTKIYLIVNQSSPWLALCHLIPEQNLESDYPQPPPRNFPLSASFRWCSSIQCFLPVIDHDMEPAWNLKVWWKERAWCNLSKKAFIMKWRTWKSVEEVPLQSLPSSPPAVGYVDSSPPRSRSYVSPRWGVRLLEFDPLYLIQFWSRLHWHCLERRLVGCHISPDSLLLHR